MYAYILEGIPQYKYTTNTATTTTTITANITTPNTTATTDTAALLNNLKML